MLAASMHALLCTAQLGLGSSYMQSASWRMLALHVVLSVHLGSFAMAQDPSGCSALPWPFTANGLLTS